MLRRISALLTANVISLLSFVKSSADHKLYALDLTTGAERWSFFTGAPIRFAPTVEGQRVFVAAGDGKKLWEAQANDAFQRPTVGGPQQGAGSVRIPYPSI